MCYFAAKNDFNSFFAEIVYFQKMRNQKYVC